MTPKNSVFTGIPNRLPQTIDFLVLALRVKSQKFRTNVP